jgi:predicted permease
MEVLNEILPLVILFLIGYLMQRLKVFEKKDGDILLKIVFYISLPALILNSLPGVRINEEFILLPFIASAVILITFGLAWMSAKMLKLSRKTFGSFVVGAMILNIGFVLPFIITFFGEEGLSRIIIMDAGNGIMVMTFVYYQACRYGNPSCTHRTILKKFLLSPPLWAIAIGLAINFLSVSFPAVLQGFFRITGDLTIPLLMMTIGFYFTPAIVNFKAMFMVIFIRMGIGLILGLAAATLFALEGLTRIVVIIGLSTPVGYNTLTFSSIEELDKEFASSIVSVSILVGVFYVPLLIYLFSF